MKFVVAIAGIIVGWTVFVYVMAGQVAATVTAGILCGGTLVLWIRSRSRR